MGLGRSIAGWFKSLIALFTGNVDSARESLDRNPEVVRAKYNEIIHEKVKHIQQFKKAIASMIAQQEKKLQQVKSLSEEVGRLENLKTGAAAKAKQLVEDMKKEGKAIEAIQAHEDYKRCLNAFNDFSSTLAEKQSRIEDLEVGVNEYQKIISDHKIQLEEHLRSIDDLKNEAAEAVTDVITAREEKEINDIISGIAIEGHSEELQRLRDMRNEAKAEVRVSRELAGTDNKAQEAEFIAYANQSANNEEFDALIGLTS